MKLLLCGEGKHELGGLAAERPYRTDEPGVLEALLRRVAPEPSQVKVCDAIPWKKIRKFRAGAHRRAEERNVLGLLLHARERHYDAVAFVRDHDGDHARADIIESVLGSIDDREAPRIAGGVAVMTLDAWCLALQGLLRSERDKHPKRTLEAAGIDSTADRVSIVDEADLDHLPQDAYSLHTWIDRARALWS